MCPLNTALHRVGSLALALLSLGCTGQLGSVGDSEGVDESDDSDGSDGPPAPVQCEDGACPGGGTCRLGECVPDCSSIDDCPANYRCDEASALCTPDPLDVCPCDAPKFCSFGTCTSPPRPADCDPTNPLEAVCSAVERCIDTGDVEGPEMTQCFGMRPCPASGECEPGGLGAVCNEGLIPTKDRVCLIGHCVDASDCPTDYKCVTAGQSYGLCSPGTFGSICEIDSDCISNNCLTIVPGTLGVCG